MKKEVEKVAGVANQADVINGGNSSLQLFYMVIQFLFPYL